MEFATPEFKELLSTFNEHEVKYLVVGAHAVMKYPEPRYTKDLAVRPDGQYTTIIIRSDGPFYCEAIYRLDYNPK